MEDDIDSKKACKVVLLLRIYCLLIARSFTNYYLAVSPVLLLSQLCGQTQQRIEALHWSPDLEQDLQRQLKDLFIHPMSDDPKEFNADHHRPTRAKRSRLAGELSNPDRVMHQATPEVGAKPLSYENALLEPATKISKDMAPSLKEGVFSPHTVTRATEDVVVASLRVTPMLPNISCSRRRSLSLSRRPTREERSGSYGLIFVEVEVKTNVWMIVEIRLMKWRSTLKSQIVSTVKPMFEEALQGSPINSKNGLKTAMFNVVEQTLGKVVRIGHAPTITIVWS